MSEKYTTANGEASGSRRLPIERRTFLKDGALLAGGLMAANMSPTASSGPVQAKAENASERWRPAQNRPNILVILVDQLRFPQGDFDQDIMDSVAPNLARLRSESVSFEHQYVAATMCSPSRACMLTGLYTHQNGMFLTNAAGLIAGAPTPPDLNPDFPTWGSILSSAQFGYRTYWWGKWHLSLSDATTPDYAEQYGFNAGGLPCPAPNGGPGQGLGVDPVSTEVFENWLADAGQSGPWCTTVSLTNPHDIAWFPRYTIGDPEKDPPVPPQPGEDNPPSLFQFLPPNFENWPNALNRQGKPTLQQAFVWLTDLSSGFMPMHDDEPGFPNLWHELLDLYAQVTHFVDIQIGAVLQALEDSGLADNTIVIFTADHGEYAGSHGLRNKGYANYEEAIRVPLYVKDPTKEFVPEDQAGKTRSELTSHVDLLPLLMTLASGDNSWRSRTQYSYLAGRADLAAMLRDPDAKGRDYILHTSDEDLPEESPRAGVGYGDLREILAEAGHPPTHVIGYRTKDAKLGVYSYFTPGTISIAPEGQQLELYDYQQDETCEEVVNRAAPNGSKPEPVLTQTLYDALFDPSSGALVNELREPLPNFLKQVQRKSINDYIAFEEEVASVDQEEGNAAATDSAAEEKLYLPGINR